MSRTISMDRYARLLALQEQINLELKTLFEAHRDRGREHVSSVLVNGVEALVDRLNEQGWTFYRCSYGGDIDFEYSEQAYSNGEKMGDGVVLAFHGFSCQVSWFGR